MGQELARLSTDPQLDVENLSLGDRVVFNETLRRVHAYYTGADQYRDTRVNPILEGGPIPDKIWTKVPFRKRDDYSRPSTQDTVSGIVTGVRFMSDGRTEGGYDEPRSYTPTQSFKVYLVTWDLYRKPALVLPSQIIRGTR